jgi:hypothetical protein
MLNLCAQFTLPGLQIQTTFHVSNMTTASRTVAVFVNTDIQEMVRAEFVHFT